MIRLPTNPTITSFTKPSITTETHLSAKKLSSFLPKNTEHYQKTPFKKALQALTIFPTWLSNTATKWSSSTSVASSIVAPDWSTSTTAEKRGFCYNPWTVKNTLSPINHRLISLLNMLSKLFKCLLLTRLNITLAPKIRWNNSDSGSNTLLPYNLSAS